MRNYLHSAIVLLIVITVTVLSQLSFAYANNSHPLSFDTTSVSEKSLFAARKFAASKELAKTTSVHSSQDEKTFNSVKVFYNPVAEQIAVTFKLSRNADISVKVMDALGNEVMNLFNDKLESGMQSLSFENGNKLTAGFYFVRVSSGNESVIKRISIR